MYNIYQENPENRAKDYCEIHIIVNERNKKYILFDYENLVNIILYCTIINNSVTYKRIHLLYYRIFMSYFCK